VPNLAWDGEQPDKRIVISQTPSIGLGREKYQEWGKEENGEMCKKARVFGILRGTMGEGREGQC